ncbi:hypothetical protein BT63DRAFT_473848 [Microthyrium microscopicum]|uniref:Uncharacterized protein n=1 Tax=Microthyrium microscopicum TaxID=703497 RepID=A0A6A6UP60_9PEZI|nr:hypothetical protein BT63DRAFT_473848 [Microthyrium microscopicum]
MIQLAKPTTYQTKHISPPKCTFKPYPSSPPSSYPPPTHNQPTRPSHLPQKPPTRPTTSLPPNPSPPPSPHPSNAPPSPKARQTNHPHKIHIHGQQPLPRLPRLPTGSANGKYEACTPSKPLKLWTVCPSAAVFSCGNYGFEGADAGVQ